MFCQFCGELCGRGGNACGGCWSAIKAGVAARFNPSTGESLLQPRDTVAGELGHNLEISQIEFTIIGEPIGKPRYRKGDQSPRVKRYRAWAQLAVASAPPLPAAELVVALSWRACLSPPKSVAGRKLNAADREALHGQRATRKPDRDNIDKALLDALFADDAAITKGTIEKVYGPIPRLDVTITHEVQT